MEEAARVCWKGVVGLLLLRISAELSVMRTNDLSDRYQRLRLQEEEEDLLAPSHPYNVV